MAKKSISKMKNRKTAGPSCAVSEMAQATGEVGAGMITEQMNEIIEGVHLTLTPHIFFVQVKSGACYITGQWWRVQNEIKET